MILSLQAPAKINLMLHITGRYHNGYHHIQSVFAFTDFCDEITLKTASDFQWTYEVASYIRRDEKFSENNGIEKAWQWFQNRFSVIAPIHIHLKKNIPIGAGLGGGSSDIAAILYGLGCLQKFSREQWEKLEEASGELGADVRICLQYQRGQGKSFWLDGIGTEGGMPIKLWENPWTAILFNPGLVLETACVYRHYQEREEAFQSPILGPVSQWLNILRRSKNDLLSSVLDLYPDLNLWLDRLGKSKGCFFARLSGSGPTIFALYPRLKDALDVFQSLEGQYSGKFHCISVC